MTTRELPPAEWDLLNALATQCVQGPNSAVVDNATVTWDGTSGRLVK